MQHLHSLGPLADNNDATFQSMKKSKHGGEGGGIPDSVQGREVDNQLHM